MQRPPSGRAAAKQQSSRELPSFDPPPGTQTAAVQIARFSPEISRHPSHQDQPLSTRRHSCNNLSLRLVQNIGQVTGRGRNKNHRNKPMQSQLPMHLSQRCRAHSRRSGKPCRNGAMNNGRCRMHGGKATGAPRGNKNALKHGNYSAKEQARRAAVKYILRMF